MWVKYQLIFNTNPDEKERYYVTSISVFTCALPFPPESFRCGASAAGAFLRDNFFLLDTFRNFFIGRQLRSSGRKLGNIERVAWSRDEIRWNNFFFTFSFSIIRFSDFRPVTFSNFCNLSRGGGPTAFSEASFGESSMNARLVSFRFAGNNTPATPDRSESTE